MSPPVNDSITNEPVNQGEDPVPRMERVIHDLRQGGVFGTMNDPASVVERTARMIDAPPEQRPLTVEVTLNARDSEAVRALAEEEYRTPAQQVGWIVSRWLKDQRPAVAGKATSQFPPTTPPPAEPRLIPVYHRGDGSAGSGCGKVGLLFARPLEGKTIGVGDVFKTDETPWTKEDGPLTCCQCGGAMVPSMWTYDL